MYTSLLQARKLEKLGLNTDSADMYFYCLSTVSVVTPVCYNYKKQIMDASNVYMAKYLHGKDIKDIIKPCWSVSALFGTLPMRYWDVDVKPILMRDGACGYLCGLMDKNGVWMKKAFAKTDIDAVFRLIILLLREKNN